jgi:hypothetical protein
VCGNDYDKAFSIETDRTHVFDGFQSDPKFRVGNGREREALVVSAGGVPRPAEAGAANVPEASRAGRR